MGGHPGVTEDLQVSVGRLQQVLATRDLIAQAKGVIRSLTGCTDGTAFQLLTKLSRTGNHTLPDVADMLVSATGSGGGLPPGLAAAYARGLDLIREQGTLDRVDLSTPPGGVTRGQR